MLQEVLARPEVWGTLALLAGLVLLARLGRRVRKVTWVPLGRQVPWVLPVLQVLMEHTGTLVIQERRGPLVRFQVLQVRLALPEQEE